MEAAMKPVLIHVGWKFGISWIAASLVGYAVGAIIAFVAHLGHWYYANNIGFILVGFFGAFGQWLVLRGKTDRSAWWLPASAAGWLICLASSALCHRFESSFLIVAWLLPIGVLQWLVFQKKSCRFFWLIPVWAGAIILAFYAGIGVGCLTEDILCHSYSLGAATTIAIGLITGACALGLIFGILTVSPLILHLQKYDEASAAPQLSSPLQ
jgi:hypothetical protein